MTWDGLLTGRTDFGERNTQIRKGRVVFCIKPIVRNEAQQGCKRQVTYDLLILLSRNRTILLPVAT